jgi:hypothetical protein
MPIANDPQQLAEAVARQLRMKPRQTINEIVKGSGLNKDEVVFGLMLLERRLVAGLTYSLEDGA